MSCSLTLHWDYVTKKWLSDLGSLLFQVQHQNTSIKKGVEHPLERSVKSLLESLLLVQYLHGL